MDGLKQRIIGALVLVCLAVIFVPMIFDEPHSERQSTPITIPEEPPFPEVDMPEEPTSEARDYGLDNEPATVQQSGQQRDSDLAEATEQAPVVETAGAPAGQEDSGDYRLIEDPEQLEDATEMVEETPAEAPGSAEFTRSLEGAWVVQLGSFGNADNARNLRDEVIELGYDAHLQVSNRGDKQLTRVFSGPFADKADAEKAKKRLDDAFKLDSLVTRGGK